MHWLLAFLLFLTGCAGVQCRSTPHAALKQMQDRTVLVSAQCSDGGHGGSGVYLRRAGTGALFATAAHVVDGECSGYRVNGHLAVLAGIDKLHDVAVLMTANRVLAVALPTQYNTRIDLGAEVVAVGFPGDMFTGARVATVTRGHVVQRGARWRMSASVWFGSSGGPVFDSRGRLLGLATNVGVWFGKPIADHYYFTPSGWVKNLVKEL